MVTPFLPSPPRFGGQQRIHALAAGLARAHDVSVLSLVDPGEPGLEQSLKATRAYCEEVVAVPGPKRAAEGVRKRLLQLGSLVSPWSYERVVHRERALQEALDRLLAAGRFDVVQLELAHMAGYRIGDARRRPVICLDEHNVEYEIVRRTAEAEASPLRRAYSTVDWRKVRREERAAWERVDGCAVTSPRDRQHVLADAPGTRTEVVPNGVDVDYFRPGDRLRREPRSLLFFGAIDYYPNTDAILYFLREVMPRLRAHYPGVSLTIVGRKAPEAVLAQAGPDVRITGTVDDLRPWLERATVVVVPLRIGGGTRLKIVEAMAMGKAIVSTTLGAEGLDVLPERDLLLADDPVRFAAQVGRLLDDTSLVDWLGDAGRRLVEAHYGWHASVERLVRLYERLLLTRRRP